MVPQLWFYNVCGLVKARTPPRALLTGAGHRFSRDLLAEDTLELMPVPERGIMQSHTFVLNVSFVGCRHSRFRLLLHTRKCPLYIVCAGSGIISVLHVVCHTDLARDNESTSLTEIY